MNVPNHIKAATLTFNGKGLKSNAISKQLSQKYSFKFTPRGIRNFLKRSKQHEPTRASQERKTFVKDIHLQYINFAMKQNPNLTANELKRKLYDVFGFSLSVSRIKFYRKKLGWTANQTGYCQMIADKNKCFRKKWSLYMLSTKEDFKDIIFTDETTVEMCSAGSLTFHCKGAAMDSIPSKAPKPKHAYKVHVWGGISYRGRTSICIFTGIMDSITYQQILNDNLLPFARQKFPDGYLLYQDNDSKHKSKSTTEWLTENNVDVVTAPASSPDINPIENVWAAMKDYLKRTEKPKTKDALVVGIINFWNTLTPGKCGTFIDHIHKVLPVTVLNNGGPTGY